MGIGRVRVMFTVRNRFAMTKYTLENLFRSVDKNTWKLEVFLYDNLSEFDMEERAVHYIRLLESNKLAQVTFNTKDSTNNAFSKAASNNQFADFHMNSLDRKEIRYVVMMDNDMLCLPGWLDLFDKAWRDIDSVDNLKNEISVVTQHPGGVVGKVPVKINGTEYKRGTSGGSGFWVVKSNFFNKVGKLDLNSLVGRNKGHDQRYWYKIQKKTGVYKYIMTVPCQKILHLGGICGSVCNVLQRKGEMELHRVEKGFKKKIKGLTPEQVAKRYPKFFRW